MNLTLYIARYTSYMVQQVYLQVLICVNFTGLACKSQLYSGFSLYRQLARFADMILTGINAIDNSQKLPSYTLSTVRYEM